MPALLNEPILSTTTLVAWALFLLMSAGYESLAEITVAPIFSDNMVLQRHTAARLG